MVTPIRSVLFDLDGTLADTAPDLGGAANDLLAELGRPPLPLECYRSESSQGARGMLAVALGMHPQDRDYDHHRTRYLALYAARVSRDTRLFSGVSDILDYLDTRGLPWGIVTNKPMLYTQPLVDALNLPARTPCIVGGDSAARPKPAPDPLLMACATLAVDPATTLYIGDDPRDIEAGRAAGMHVAAAGWGYIQADTDPATWGADLVLSHVSGLIPLLERCNGV